MRDLGIFQNRTQLNKESDGIVMVHQDDMPMYCSWFLTSERRVDEILYRGPSDKLKVKGLQEALKVIGYPLNIIVTKSNKDTY